jgi:hypothetical protein
MKLGVLLLGISGLAALTTVAFADEPPRARVGFQMDMRTGYSLPMGHLAQGEKMSDLVSGQVPFVVDLGAKVIPELFLGGYFGLSFGGAGGATKAACDATGGSCTGIAVQLGIEAQYQIIPAGLADPWIGYGFGFESLALSETVGGTSNSLSYGGFEFARLSAGVDFRVNRVFGVGPFVDWSLGQYSTISQGSVSQDIPNTATHQWLTLGARFVFFP